MPLRAVVCAVSMLLSLPAAAGATAFEHLQPVTAGGATLDLGIWTPGGTGLPLVLIVSDDGVPVDGHADTARALADAGFVVAAVGSDANDVRHAGEVSRLLDRSVRVEGALDFMLGTWSGHARLDPASVGMFGYAAGGFAALVVAGGEPDLTLIPEHCNAHPTELACRRIAAGSEGTGGAPVVALRRPSDTRVHALAIAEPALGFTFAGGGLRDVGMPVQLWRAGSDAVFPEPFYVEPVYDALPKPALYTVIPDAGHDDFLAPCPASAPAPLPETCASPAGFDRAAFHVRFNAALVAFFAKALQVK
jgi:predicted dienelactone hydrolase